MLKSIYSKNYKNITGKFNFKNLSILIGSNGSGKSNLISYLQFLKYCLTPVSDESKGVTSFENAISKLGDIRILDNYISSPAKIHFKYVFSNLLSEISQDILLSFEVKIHEKEFKIVSERIYFYDENNNQLYCYIFHNQQSGKLVMVFSNNAKKEIDLNMINEMQSKKLSLQNLDDLIPIHIGNKNYTKEFINHLIPKQLIPINIDGSSLFVQDKNIYKIGKSILDNIDKWKFYNANNMNLNAIRKPKIGSTDIYLSSSGHNLALVLENLVNQNTNFLFKINQLMKTIIPKTRKIRPVRLDGLAVTVAWHFEGTNKPFYLSEISDGTVRMLCWAIILHSPCLPSLLVIDKPELGLHVIWLGILAEWIKEASQKTQIIITTHSPDLLDKFTDCLENVICFHSDDQKHFSAKYLSEEKIKNKFKKGWKLGDLYRISGFLQQTSEYNF